MKINLQTKIVGDLVLLVPYREIHVLKYHQWMASEELQKLTASEPLSLDEEFQMQKTWAADEDKCTFIILDKATYDKTNDEVGSMIGDTNLFFMADTDEKTAEIEIMIAEKSFHRSGRGRESTLLMLKYGIEQLGVKKFHAKIGVDNTASIQMFQKLGFAEVGRSEVFGEITFAVAFDHEAFVHFLNGAKYSLSGHCLFVLPSY